MKSLQIVLLLAFLTIISNCTTTHDKLLNAPLGLSTSEVVQRFGSPFETIDDVNFTHWVYHSETKRPNSKIPRKWVIKYSFQQGTLVEIAPEMVPHPDELKEIEEEAKERLRRTDPKRQEENTHNDGNFKQL